MEKKTFVTLVMSVVGGMLFAMGMCMCLLPEWEMFNQGVVLAAVGLVELLITALVYCKKSGIKIKVNAKLVGKVIYGIFAACVFGAGMSMTMAFEGMMLPGIVVGIVGIVLLLFLIPMCVGLKDSNKQNN